MAARSHAAFAMKVAFPVWPAEQLVSYIRCGIGLLAVVGVSPVWARASGPGQSCASEYLADTMSFVGGHLS